MRVHPRSAHPHSAPASPPHSAPPPLPPTHLECPSKRLRKPPAPAGARRAAPGLAPDAGAACGRQRAAAAAAFGDDDAHGGGAHEQRVVVVEGGGAELVEGGDAAGSVRWGAGAMGWRGGAGSECAGAKRTRRADRARNRGGHQNRPSPRARARIANLLTALMTLGAFSASMVVWVERAGLWLGDLLRRLV